VTAIVWRRVSRNRFFVVGSNILQCPSEGKHTVRVVHAKQIQVRPGDVVGIVSNEAVCTRPRNGSAERSESFSLDISCL
jgi:hypothetical protein